MTIVMIVVAAIILIIALMCLAGVLIERSQAAMERRRRSMYVVIVQCAVNEKDGSYSWLWDDAIVRISSKNHFSENRANEIAEEINLTVKQHIETNQLRALVRIASDVPFHSIFPMPTVWTRQWEWTGKKIGPIEVAWLKKLFEREHDWEAIDPPEWEWNPNFY